MPKPTETPPPAEKPKRLSLSQILEHMLTRGGAERSAVTLTRNATGGTQIEVKVRTGEDGEIVSVEDAERKAAEVYERLQSQYPAEGSHENAEVTLTRNAKGETQIDTKIKTSGDGVTTIAEAEAQASEVFERLRVKYPLSNGAVARAPNKE
jgi:uncharacterized protein YxeA